MKIKIERPYSADKSVGETEMHYGVPFLVEESDSTGSLLVADIPEEEAQAMIDAGRAVLVEESEGPTRDEMKAFLAEKGVEFPANIKGEKLAELYATTKAE